MGAHISPYSRGFMWWSQQLGNPPEVTKGAIAQAQIMAQGSLVSYIDSFMIFGSMMLVFLWLPFLLKRPTRGAPIHLE